MKFSLYYYDMCPFCQRVLHALRQIELQVERRNVLENPAWRSQQQQATGRTTVPCLLIENDQGEQTWMYESGDIIRFLRDQ